MLHSVKIAHQLRQKYCLSKNCLYDNFLRRENQRRLTKTDKTKKKVSEDKKRKFGGSAYFRNAQGIPPAKDQALMHP